MDDGIILIDKPVGVSSFYVTSQVKRKLGVRRAGHAGTLDPMASGVLPVMIGRATRLIDLLPEQNKRYVASFLLGMTTDTLDITGEVLTDQPVCATRAQVEAVLPNFLGEQLQVPPMYSALRKDGVRLYDLARQGVEIERPARQCRIAALSLTGDNSASQGEDTVYTIDVTCSKGTYIRTLIDDIGQKLGCGAVMTSLRRTASNGFSIARCIPLEEFLDSDPTPAPLRPEEALTDCPKLTVTAAQAVRFSNGGALSLCRLTLPQTSKLYRVYAPDERFLGLGAPDMQSACLKPRWVLENHG